MTTFDARVETWDGSDSEDAVLARMLTRSRCSSCSAPLRKGAWSFADVDGLPVCTACTHVCTLCGHRLVRGFWRETESGKVCRTCNQVAARVAAECNALADRRRRVAAARSVVAAALATRPVTRSEAATDSVTPRPPGWVPDDLTLARSRRHWRTIDAAMTAAAQTHQPREGGDRRPGDLVAAARAVVVARARRETR